MCRRQVDGALERIRRVLSTERAPGLPADTRHTYADKYNLAEWLTNLELAAELNCLEMLGLEGTRLATLRGWAATRNVTLRFRSEERCTFSRQEERVEEADVRHEKTSRFFGKTTTTHVNKFTDFFWDYEFEYSLVAFQGEPQAPRVTSPEGG